MDSYRCLPFTSFDHSRSLVRARSALASSLVLAAVGIRFIVRMAYGAVSSVGFLTTSDVLTLCDCFQMVRIHTRTVPTQMVQMKTFGNLSLSPLVSHPVSVVDTSAHPELAVSEALRSSPDPATIRPLVDLFPEPVLSTTFCHVVSLQHGSPCKDPRAGQTTEW